MKHMTDEVAELSQASTRVVEDAQQQVQVVAVEFSGVAARTIQA